MYFIAKQPRIDYSMRWMMCQRFKYFIIGFPCLIFALVLLFSCLIMATSVVKFSYHWLTLLDHKKSYECTSRSLWVDLDELNFRYGTSESRTKLIAIIICSGF